MAGSRVKVIFVYKGFTRSLEIGNTPVWILANIWRLERVRDATYGANVSDKKLLNTAKPQSYSFYSFWVMKGKITGSIVSSKVFPPLTLSQKSCPPPFRFPPLNQKFSSTHLFWLPPLINNNQIFPHPKFSTNIARLHKRSSNTVSI